MLLCFYISFIISLSLLQKQHFKCAYARVEDSNYALGVNDASLNPASAQNRILYYKVFSPTQLSTDRVDYSTESDSNSGDNIYETYGPFSEQQVIEWWKAGYFDDNLQVSNNLNGNFIPMKSYLTFNNDWLETENDLTLSAANYHSYENVQSVDIDQGYHYPTEVKKKKRKSIGSTVLNKITRIGKKAKDAFLHESKKLSFVAEPISNGGNIDDFDVALEEPGHSSSVENYEDTIHNNFDTPSEMDLGRVSNDRVEEIVAEKFPDDKSSYKDIISHQKNIETQQFIDENRKPMGSTESVQFPYDDTKYSVGSLGKSGYDLWSDDDNKFSDNDAFVVGNLFSQQPSSIILSRKLSTALFRSLGVYLTHLSYLISFLLRTAVPIPVQVATSSLAILATSKAALPLSLIGILRLLQIFLQYISLAIFYRFAFDVPADGGTPTSLSGRFSVDMSALPADFSASSVAAASDECSSIQEYWQLFSRGARAISTTITGKMEGIARSLPRSLGETRTVDWKEAVNSKDIRTIMQYFHYGVIEGLKLLGSMLSNLFAKKRHELTEQIAFHQSVTVKQFISFFRSNSAITGLIISLFIAIFIQNIAIPALQDSISRIKYSRPLVGHKGKNPAKKSDPLSVHMHFVSSSSSLIAVLSLTAVAYFLLSPPSESISEAVILSNSPIAVVIRREIRVVLKFFIIAAVIELLLIGRQNRNQSELEVPSRDIALAKKSSRRLGYLSGLLSDEEALMKCKRWNLTPYIVTLLEVERANARMLVDSLNSKLLLCSTLEMAAISRRRRFRMLRSTAWTFTAFYFLSRSTSRVLLKLSDLDSQGSVDVDFVGALFRLIRYNFERLFGNSKLSSGLKFAFTEMPFEFVRWIHCLLSSSTKCDSSYDSLFAFRPSKVALSTFATSNFLFLAILIVLPLILWQSCLSLLRDLDVATADYFSSDSSRSSKVESLRQLLNTALDFNLPWTPEVPGAEGPDWTAEGPDPSAGIKVEKSSVSIKDTALCFPPGTITVFCTKDNLSDFNAVVRSIFEGIGCQKNSATRRRAVEGQHGFEGEIIVDGRNTKDWSIAALQKRVTYLSDDEDCFELQAGAVAGCLPGASNDDFKRFLAAAEVSGAQSIFRSLPDGLATFLRKNAEVSAEEDEAKHIDLDSSVELKSDEWKRLSLCRALTLPWRPILLMDLASFAMTEREELRLLAHLRDVVRQSGGRQIVLMSAVRVDPSAVAQFADFVVIVEEGGSFTQLSAKEYWNFCNRVS